MRRNNSKLRLRRSASFCLPFLLGTSCGFLNAVLIFWHAHVVERSVTLGPHAGPWVQQPAWDEETNDPRWKTIHVYIGDTATSRQIAEASTIDNDYFFAHRWFSQAQQDLVVSKLLRGKRNGYFVDLAANDVVKISNTYALERYFGWRGLAIEPNHLYWGGLAYRNCDVVAAVVGSGGKGTFHFPTRAAATVSASVAT